MANMTSDEAKSTLIGANADTRQPPDVQRNTHVIGLLGTNDRTRRTRDAASPRNDGWMVSDFYLWKNILKGMGKSQTWITCEDPNVLVEKYASGERSVPIDPPTFDGNTQQASWREGYLHGDPFEERVIALDEKTLPFAQKDLVVTNRGIDLRNSFLNIFGDTCAKAQQADEPVLVLIFAQGDYDYDDNAYHGLVIGVDPQDHPRNFLHSSEMASIYARTPNVRLSMFHTSCFSGHWITAPELSLRRPDTMAAALESKDSSACVRSTSQRHAGAVYISAFLTELQKEAAELPEDTNAEQVRLYRDLQRGIIAEYERLCIPSRSEIGGSTPKYTQEAVSEQFWRRTGYELTHYKRNYDALQKVAASDPNPYLDKKRDMDTVPAEEVAAWQARHPEGCDPEESERTAGYGTTHRGLTTSSLLYIANYYWKSFPGSFEVPSNTTLHSVVELYLAGATMEDEEQLQSLRRTLVYRVWMMGRANEYVKWLGLQNVPRIEDWNPENPPVRPCICSYKEIYTALSSAGLFAGLFSRPDEFRYKWGVAYRKPFYYLSYAFSVSGYQLNDLEALITKLREGLQRLAIKRASRVTKTARRTIGRMKELRQASWRISKSKKKEKRISLQEAGLRPYGEGESSGQ